MNANVAVILTVLVCPFLSWGSEKAARSAATLPTGTKLVSKEEINLLANTAVTPFGKTIVEPDSWEKGDFNLPTLLFTDRKWAQFEKGCVFQHDVKLSDRQIDRKTELIIKQTIPKQYAKDHYNIHRWVIFEVESKEQKLPFQIACFDEYRSSVESGRLWKSVRKIPSIEFVEEFFEIELSKPEIIR